MIVYVGSRSPLPLIPWREDAPAFNVTELSPEEERVRSHFSLPHIRCAGSHTSCGCGFNEGREYPYSVDASAERVPALESASRLASYVRDYRVEQVYSCWSGDESDQREFERQVTPEGLFAEDFFFRERELLTITQDAV